MAGLSFESTANINTATVNLGTKKLTINNYENDVYAGLFTGTGSIIKKGSGYQTFSGSGAISQKIELQAGRLISDGTNGGGVTGTVTVSGSGSLATSNSGYFKQINVVSGGNLLATNNALKATGVNFQDGSTLTVASRINNGTSELRGLQVSGGTVAVDSGASVYLDLSNTLAWKPTSPINIINSGTTVTGQFTSVEVSDILLKAEVVNGNQIQLAADTDWAAGVTGNSKTLRTFSRALALGAFAGDGQSQWGYISADLQALKDAYGDKGLRSGLIGMVGPLNGISSLLQPGTSGWYSPMPAVDELTGRLAPVCGDRQAGDNRFWFSPYYSKSSVDGYQDMPGYRLSRPGVNMGYDRRFTDEFTGGLMVGFSKPEAKVDDSFYRAEVRADQFLGGLYGAWNPGPVVFGGWAHYGFSDYHSSRRVTVNNERRNISADYNGRFWGAGLTADLPVALSDRLTLSPNAGLSYNHSRVDGYREKNGGVLDQRVSDFSSDTLMGRVGVKADYEMDGGRVWASAHLNQVLSGDRVSEVTASLVGSNVPFVVESPRLDRTTYSLAAGADYHLTEGLSLNAAAEADLGARQQTYAITGGLKGVWGQGIDFWSPVAGLFTASSAGSEDGMVEKAPKFEGLLANSPVNYTPDEGYTLPEVVITADGSRPVSERAASVDEITSEMIKTSGSKDLAEALRPVTGLTQRVAPQGSHIDIRGMRTRGVMLLIDGVPMSSVRNNNFNASLFPTANIERIKITKGGSSVLYGPGGNAGVLNIITKKGREGFSPTLGLEAGSPGATLTQSLSAAMGGEKVKSFFSYYGSDSDGFQPAKTNDDNSRITVDKLRSNSQNEIHNIYANVSYSPEDETEIGLSVNYRQGDYGIPTRTDRIRKRWAEWETVDDWRATSVSLALRREFDGPFTLRGWGYVNQEDRDRSIYDDYERTSQRGLGSGDFNSINENYGLDTQLIYSPQDNFSATLALGAKREGYKSHDYYISEAQAAWTRTNENRHATITNTALELDYQPEALPGLGLSAGYGYYTQKRPEGTQRDNSYMLAAIWDINETHQVWANHARKVRFPNLEEYYDATRGNQNLDAEIVKHYEIGWRGRFESLKSELSVTGFWADADSYIENDEVTNIKQNFDYRFRGVETNLAVRPLEWLLLRGGYTFTDAEDRDPGPYATGNLQYRPRHKYSLAADMAFDSGIKFHLETNYLRDIYNTLKSSPTTEDIKSDNYTVTHMKLGYDFGQASEVYVKIENLFDADYAESEGLLRPGRTFFLGLNLGF